MNSETKTPTLHSASLHAVVVFSCSCPSTPLLVLTGISDIQTCPDCRRRYIVGAITHQPKPDGTFDTNVQLGQINELAAAVMPRSLEMRRVRS
jgi:hypothetical protein